MSAAQRPRAIFERVLQLNMLHCTCRPAAGRQVNLLIAEPAPVDCRQALEQSRRRTARDLELQDLLMELGAELVDAVQHGRGEELLEALAGLADLEAGEPPTAPEAEHQPPVEEARAGDGLAQPVELPGRGISGTRPQAAPLPDPRPVHATAPPVRVTPEMLRLLQKQMAQNILQREQRAAEHQAARRQQQRERLMQHVEHLGQTPASLGDPQGVHQEVALLELTLPRPPRHWADLGKEANHALTSWATARARAAQQAALALQLTGEAERLERLFPRLSHHSETSRPGSVMGLAKWHTPRGSDWLEDARAQELRLRTMLLAVEEPVTPAPSLQRFDDDLRQLAEEVRLGMGAASFGERVRLLLARGLPPAETRLVRLARPFAAELEGGELWPLRRAVERDLLTEAEQEGEEASPLPADWPWFAYTRGKRCALVGGEPRPERRQRLQEVFGFEQLVWPPNPNRGIRRTHALTRQMLAGTLDVVIVLRAFISHKVSDKLFATEAERCRTIQADSYGVTQVRLGFERFLPSPSERDILVP